MPRLPYVAHPRRHRAESGEMHRLNNNQWSALQDNNAVIPISREISLDVESTSSQDVAETLLEREWKYRSEKRLLDPEPTLKVPR